MESLEEVLTTQIGLCHTTIPPIYTYYNNGNNLKYNCTLMHTGHTDVTKCKTTPTCEQHCVHNHTDHMNTTTYIIVLIPLAGLAVPSAQTMFQCTQRNQWLVHMVPSAQTMVPLAFPRKILTIYYV
jgi:hypothetical protein